jgi:hypothetical protein
MDSAGLARVGFHEKFTPAQRSRLRDHLDRRIDFSAIGFGTLSHLIPVYKLWQGRFTEAWHQLPQPEQQRLLSLVMEGLNTAGGKELVMCSAAWSNERWPFFGVEEFPDMEAVQRHEQILTDLNWARYIDSRTTLGTELILPQ